MSEADLTQDGAPSRRSLAGPKCEACGSITVLKNFSPHPTLPGDELRTYVCPACECEEVVTSPQPNDAP